MDEAALRAQILGRVSSAFGDRFARAWLYGSRARGDARPDSDWDIAVELSDAPTPADLHVTVALRWAIYDATPTQAWVNIKLLAPRDWEKRTIFHCNLRMDAVPL